MRAFTAFLVLGVLAAAVFAAPQADSVVKYFVVQYPAISPNGDGIRDESLVQVGIPPADVDTVLLILGDSLMTQVLDTLLYEVAPGDTEFTVLWQGTDRFDSPLPEGAYRLHLHAAGPDTTEDHDTYAIVDITAPLVQLDRITPGIYTPGVEGSADKVQIHYIVSNSRQGDSLVVTIAAPGGAAERQSPAWEGDGSFGFEWSADTSAADGIYTVAFSMYDEAGNTSSDQGFIDVDTEGPAIGFITEVPTHTADPPAAIEGYCFDRNGIEDPLFVWEINDTLPPDDSFLRNDTLFWQFDLTDRIKEYGVFVEDTYTLQVLCADIFGAGSENTVSFTLDTSPPPAPSLAPAAEIVYEPSVDIEIAFDTDEVDSITLYREYGGETTSVTLRFGMSPFPYTASLLEAYPSFGGSPRGLSAEPALTNTFWATAKDKAGNMSGTSNIVRVAYDNSSGIYYPEAFREPGIFQIRTAAEASRVEVVIFTLTGERVVRLGEWGPDTIFDLHWDLTNEDGEEVRNGPYVVVVTIDYNGTKTVEKNFIAVVR